MSDLPHTQGRPVITDPVKPPKEDIPVALEYKLEMLIDGVKRMVGAVDPPVIGPYPDPREFDPETDPFPHYKDIPASLEWKLDTELVFLNRILGLLGLFALLVLIGLATIIGWLIAIWIQLGVIAGLLGALLGMLGTLLTAIFILLAFFVIRLVVPLVRRLHL